MSLDEQTVRSIFAGLEHGDGDAFFEHVADDVDWTVMGTHPLAGRYHSKAAFKAATFSKLAKVLPDGVQLGVAHVVVAGDVAVVELVAGATARNGMRFDNHYCWVVRFDGGLIVEVRAYLDSALVAELFRQNPI
jgi:ketosteroid isomerase-like protein